MTDLQLGLLAIGALAVLAVVVYNRWQERSARRQAERAFGAGHADVLLVDDRREPTLPQRREPAPETRRSAAAPAPAMPAEQIDYVIELMLPKPLPAPVVPEAW